MKYEQQLARIREILLDVWDPLGVGKNWHLHDEYDGFLPRIFTALRKGDHNSLYVMFDDIERELGVTSSHDQRTRAMQALLSLGAR
jgi:hypothetical protein